MAQALWVALCQLPCSLTIDGTQSSGGTITRRTRKSERGVKLQFTSCYNKNTPTNHTFTRKCTRRLSRAHGHSTWRESASRAPLSSMLADGGSSRRRERQTRSKLTITEPLWAVRVLPCGSGEVCKLPWTNLFFLLGDVHHFIAVVCPPEKCHRTPSPSSSSQEEVLWNLARHSRGFFALEAASLPAPPRLADGQGAFQRERDKRSPRGADVGGREKADWACANVRMAYDGTSKNK